LVSHRGEKERWIVNRTVLAIAVLAASLVVAQAATGSATRVHVSGTYAVTDFGAFSCAPGGSPFVLRCTTTGFASEYAGSLTGTSVADFTQIIDCKTGRTHGHGTETFTGSLEGVGSGTLTWGIHFASDFDCATFAVSGFTGRGVVTSGAGALAGLNGSIAFGEVDYDGELH
jgi:hypothetical protein